jgi:hypothetical protein
VDKNKNINVTLIRMVIYKDQEIQNFSSKQKKSGPSLSQAIQKKSESSKVRPQIGMMPKQWSDL